MKKYWTAALIGAFLGLCGCEWQRTTETKTTYYPIEGISAYKGQNASELFAANGMPNQVQNRTDGSVIWIYYNNYRPTGTGETITYNTPNGIGNTTTSCRVQILLRNDIVEEVASNCQ